MMITLNALPEYRFSVASTDGVLTEAGAAAPDCARWSGAVAPPAIGAYVHLRTNRIGLACVVGYFVLDGWLGIQVRPIDPPDWYLDQVGYEAPCFAFGAEIVPADEVVHEQAMPQLGHWAALQRFANAHGRNWKSKLIEAWANGADARMDDGGLLREVRNTLGPRWLRSKHNRVRPLKNFQR